MISVARLLWVVNLVNDWKSTEQPIVTEKTFLKITVKNTVNYDDANPGKKITYAKRSSILSPFIWEKITISER